MTTYASMGKMSLRNNGGFVVQLGFVYEDRNGDRQLSRRTGDIVFGTQREADPGDLGVPDDTDVRIYAMVAAGSNNEDSTRFRYRRGAPPTAHYSISGTTLNNRLELMSHPDDSPGSCNLAIPDSIRASRLFA